MKVKVYAETDIESKKQAKHPVLVEISEVGMTDDEYMWFYDIHGNYWESAKKVDTNLFYRAIDVLSTRDFTNLIEAGLFLEQWEDSEKVKG